MTSRCADLDEFFDGELAPDQADEFRNHLVGCERCQRMLLGRMQEDLAAHVDVGGVGHTVATPAPVGAVTTAPAAALAAPAAATTSTAVTPMRAPPRRGSLRRTAIYLGPALAAAAAAVTLWFPRAPAVGFQATLEFDRAAVTQVSRSESPTRGHAAQVGDVARAKVEGERHRAIWVYLDERDLVFACPKDDPRCATDDGDLTLRLPLTARGQYAVMSLGSSEPISSPRATLDEALAMARTTGAHQQVDYIDVK